MTLSYYIRGGRVLRIILYTGKGGVGKTSIAAATSYAISKTGKRVLIISTDMAHSLGDSFGSDLSKGITHVTENLDAVEINPVIEAKKAWGNLQAYIKEIIIRKSNDGIEADEALIFSGLDELLSLLFILDRYEEASYDMMIVDCAPTGETLSMLSYSERLQVLADKVIPMVKNVNSAIGSLIAKKTSVPKPRDIVFDEFISLLKRLEKLQKLLHDREICSIRLVMTAERIPIDEARRSYMWMQLYDFGVDAVYVNKLYPDSAFEGYFNKWKEIQSRHLNLIKESFLNQRVFTLELQKDEIRGEKALERIGEFLYSKVNPEDVFCKEPAFGIEEVKGSRVFSIALPFACVQDIQTEKEGNDLILSLASETRRFHLPEGLSRRKLSSYEYKDGKLRLKFDY